jgi:hypothetical protein
LLRVYSLSTVFLISLSGATRDANRHKEAEMKSTPFTFERKYI